MAEYSFSKITPLIQSLTEKCHGNDVIDAELYVKYDVKRGLRDINGNGVVAGLTNISTIKTTEIVGDVPVPCEGKLF